MGKIKELHIKVMDILEYNLRDYNIYLTTEELYEVIDNYFNDDMIECIYRAEPVKAVDMFLDKYIHLQYNTVSDLLDITNFIYDYELTEWYNRAYGDDLVILLGNIMNTVEGVYTDESISELLDYLDSLI